MLTTTTTKRIRIRKWIVSFNNKETGGIVSSQPLNRPEAETLARLWKAAHRACYLEQVTAWEKDTGE